jgi:hypothetical protein
MGGAAPGPKTRGTVSEVSTERSRLRPVRRGVPRLSCPRGKEGEEGMETVVVENIPTAKKATKEGAKRKVDRKR